MSITTREAFDPKETTGSLAGAGRVTPSNYFRRKAIFVRLFGFFLLVISLPFIGLFAALIRLTSKGPPIYLQKRSGQGGVTFVMLKLRTTRHDAEADTGPAWSIQDDPRVTVIGRFLRRHHLDELPQFLNVVRGEMDLFGPRPERPEFGEVLSEKIPGYRDRECVLPGMAGLAQLNLPPDSDHNSVRRKLALDVEYIRTASFWLDCRLFVATVLQLLGVTSFRVLKLLRLNCEINAEFPVSEEAPARILELSSLGDVSDRSPIHKRA